MADRQREARQDGERVAAIDTWFYPKDGPKSRGVQWVVEERPVTLFLNGRELVTLLCAGHHLDELAVGFLHAEGFVDTPEDLTAIRVDAENGRVQLETRVPSDLPENLWAKRTVTSGCGKGTLFYNALDALLAVPVESPLRVSAAAVRERMADLNQLSRTYRRTHGVHNTALADADGILVFRDDIGRHNAVDMLVGHAFLERLPLQSTMLLTTGRLTSEILIKAAKVGIPLLISRNTATTLAIELAATLNITLIGYVRAGNFTVYTGVDRIE